MTRFVGPMLSGTDDLLVLLVHPCDVCRLEGEILDMAFRCVCILVIICSSHWQLLPELIPPTGYLTSCRLRLEIFKSQQYPSSPPVNRDVLTSFTIGLPIYRFSSQLSVHVTHLGVRGWCLVRFLGWSFALGVGGFTGCTTFLLYVMCVPSCSPS